MEVNRWTNLYLRLFPSFPLDLRWQIHRRPNRQRSALAITHCTAPQGQSERKEYIICWSGHILSLSLSLAVHAYVYLCLCVGREKKRINDCNKWRWTFQGLCSLPVFFSVFLSPTAKYVLISMHIYNLRWTCESPVFSEVIGLLCGAESTISNTHRLPNPSFKLWWYKAFICNSSLYRHFAFWVWWKVGLGV